MKHLPYNTYRPRSSPKSTQDAGVDIADWGYTIVVLIVMFVLIAALMPTLMTALSDYNTTESTIGTILESLVPILIGLALLLLVVAVLLKKSKEGAI